MSQLRVRPATSLTAGWASARCWRVLNTSLHDGELFFAHWAAWQTDARRPRLLHYVAIAPAAPAPASLLRALSTFPSLNAHAADFERQCFGLLPGFHRIFLQRGQVLLTLCIGALQPMLREQQFVADAVYLPATHPQPRSQTWDRWSIKALTRLCRPGTAIQIATPPATLAADLEQAGFVFDSQNGPIDMSSCTSAPANLQGQYQPRWNPGFTRHTWRRPAVEPSTCVVVGAGLAGALVATALARRGWKVTVLDAAPHPAAGASGLPVGLFAPQASRDDSARSRLSRAGVRATLASCRAMLQEGDDWSMSGVLELREYDNPGLPEDWSSAGRQWSQGGSSSSSCDPLATRENSGTVSISHTAAGWIKPMRLVQACLATPGVEFVGSSSVRNVSRSDDQWELSDSVGKLIARAQYLVVAIASGSNALLDCAANAILQPGTPSSRLAATNSVSGLISWGLQHDSDCAAFPRVPVNGHGSFVAHVPISGALAWFTGATYSDVDAATIDLPEGHRENLQRLSHLLGDVALTLTARFEQAQVSSWTGTRCITSDRLPAVGSLDFGPNPSLWVSTGMGSRGLTYAALCAELLAAQLNGEPLPIEASLAKSMAATRPQLLHHL